MRKNFNLQILRNVQGSTHPNDIAGAIKTINDIENYIDYLKDKIQKLETRLKEINNEQRNMA